MPAADRKTIDPAINSEAAEGMAKYGITRVPVDYFHYKEFRYTGGNDLDPKSSFGGYSAGEGRPLCRPWIQ
jgi:hypothetical protein